MSKNLFFGMFLLIAFSLTTFSLMTIISSSNVCVEEGYSLGDSFNVGYANYLDLAYDSSDDSFWFLNDFHAKGIDKNKYPIGEIYPQERQFFRCTGIAEDPNDDTMWFVCRYIVDLEITKQLVNFDKSNNVLSSLKIDGISGISTESNLKLLIDKRDNSFWLLSKSGYPRKIYHLDSEGNYLGEIVVNWMTREFTLDTIDNSFLLAQSSSLLHNVERVDMLGNILDESVFEIQECTNPVGFISDYSDYSFWCLQENTELDWMYQYVSSETISGTDLDGDGFMIEGGVCGLIDCDDNDFWINPGATELCWDGIDNNCNNEIDEGCAICGDSICEGYLRGEDCNTCPSDCYGDKKKCCGNGICEPSEKNHCMVDCQ